MSKHSIKLKMLSVLSYKIDSYNELVHDLYNKLKSEIDRKTILFSNKRVVLDEIDKRRYVRMLKAQHKSNLSQLRYEKLRRELIKN